MRTVTPEDIAWADLVLVMEEKHAQRIRSLLARPNAPPIVVLGIPDLHRFMSPELVESLRAAVEPILEDAGRRALPARKRC